MRDDRFDIDPLEIIDNSAYPVIFEIHRGLGSTFSVYVYDRAGHHLEDLTGCEDRWEARSAIWGYLERLQDEKAALAEEIEEGAE